MDRAKWEARSRDWRWGIPFVAGCVAIGLLTSWGIDQIMGG